MLCSTSVEYELKLHDRDRYYDHVSLKSTDPAGNVAAVLALTRKLKH